jgi:transposase
MFCTDYCLTAPISLTNLQVLNAILYVAEQGCKWRGLPKRFGRWHTIYMRMSRWAKNGVLDRVFEQLQLEQIVRIRIEAFSIDSTSVKVHPDGTGALKKRTTGHREVPRRMEHKIHMVAADARTAIGPMPEGLPLLMDRAYEGDETRQLVLDLGMIPVVPPKSNRLYPWHYDHAIYKKRNEIERLFRRLKGFRRIFSRFEKLDVLFLGFLSFALIVEALRVV